MADNFITVDIGEKYTRIADARPHGSKINVEILGQAETIPGYYLNLSPKSIQQQGQLISKLMSDLRIGRKNTAILVPDTFTYSQVMDVPRLNERELQSAIRYQADQFIPLPIDDISLDLEVIAENLDKKTTTILTVASPKSIVAQVEKTIESAGLVPDALENEISAVRRLMAENLRLKFESHYIVLNMGFSTTSLYLFDKDSRLLLSRNIKIGFELMIKDLMANLSAEVTKAEELLKNSGANGQPDYTATYLQAIFKELADEIKKMVFLAEEKHDGKVTQIFTFNLDWMIGGFANRISAETGIAVNSLFFTENISISRSVKSPPGEITSYIGAIAGNLRI